MNQEQFNKVVSDTLEQCAEVLINKSKEYSRNQDKLHNFNVGARMTGQTREQVLYGFALKHHISLMDMRQDIANGVLPTEEMVNEKFGDAINYLILEKACVINRINND